MLRPGNNNITYANIETIIIKDDFIEKSKQFSKHHVNVLLKFYPDEYVKEIKEVINLFYNKKIKETDYIKIEEKCINYLKPLLKKNRIYQSQYWYPLINLLYYTIGTCQLKQPNKYKLAQVNFDEILQYDFFSTELVAISCLSNAYAGLDHITRNILHKVQYWYLENSKLIHIQKLDQSIGNFYKELLVKVGNDLAADSQIVIEIEKTKTQDNKRLPNIIKAKMPQYLEIEAHLINTIYQSWKTETNEIKRNSLRDGIRESQYLEFLKYEDLLHFYSFIIMDEIRNCVYFKMYNPGILPVEHYQRINTCLKEADNHLPLNALIRCIIEHINTNIISPDDPEYKEAIRIQRHDMFIELKKIVEPLLTTKDTFNGIYFTFNDDKDIDISVEMLSNSKQTFNFNISIDDFISQVKFISEPILRELSQSINDHPIHADCINLINQFFDAKVKYDELYESCMNCIASYFSDEKITIKTAKNNGALDILFCIAAIAEISSGKRNTKHVDEGLYETFSKEIKNIFLLIRSYILAHKDFIQAAISNLDEISIQEEDEIINNKEKLALSKLKMMWKEKLIDYAKNNPSNSTPIHKEIKTFINKLKSHILKNEFQQALNYLKDYDAYDMDKIHLQQNLDYNFWVTILYFRILHEDFLSKDQKSKYAHLFSIHLLYVLRNSQSSFNMMLKFNKEIANIYKSESEQSIEKFYEYFQSNICEPLIKNFDSELFKLIIRKKTQKEILKELLQTKAPSKGQKKSAKKTKQPNPNNPNEDKQTKQEKQTKPNDQTKPNNQNENKKTKQANQNENKQKTILDGAIKSRHDAQTKPNIQTKQDKNENKQTKPNNKQNENKQKTVLDSAIKSRHDAQTKLTIQTKQNNKSNLNRKDQAQKNEATTSKKPVIDKNQSQEEIKTQTIKPETNKAFKSTRVKKERVAASPTIIEGVEHQVAIEMKEIVKEEVILPIQINKSFEIEPLEKVSTEIVPTVIVSTKTVLTETMTTEITSTETILSKKNEKVSQEVVDTTINETENEASQIAASFEEKKANFLSQYFIDQSEIDLLKKYEKQLTFKGTIVTKWHSFNYSLKNEEMVELSDQIKINNDIDAYILCTPFDSKAICDDLNEKGFTVEKEDKHYINLKKTLKSGIKFDLTLKLSDLNNSFDFIPITRGEATLNFSADKPQLQVKKDTYFSSFDEACLSKKMDLVFPRYGIRNYAYRLYKCIKRYEGIIKITNETAVQKALDDHYADAVYIGNAKMVYLELSDFVKHKLLEDSASVSYLNRCFKYIFQSIGIDYVNQDAFLNLFVSFKDVLYHQNKDALIQQIDLIVQYSATCQKTKDESSGLINYEVNADIKNNMSRLKFFYQIYDSVFNQTGKINSALLKKSFDGLLRLEGYHSAKQLNDDVLNSIEIYLGLANHVLSRDPAIFFKQITCFITNFYSRPKVGWPATLAALSHLNPAYQLPPQHQRYVPAYVRNPNVLYYQRQPQYQTQLQPQFPPQPPFSQSHDYEQQRSGGYNLPRQYKKDNG